MPVIAAVEDKWIRICRNPTTRADLPWQLDSSEEKTRESSAHQIKYLIKVFPKLRFNPDSISLTNLQGLPNVLDSLVPLQSLPNVRYVPILSLFLGPTSNKSIEWAASLYKTGCQIQFLQQLNFLIGRAMLEPRTRSYNWLDFVSMARRTLAMHYQQWIIAFHQTHPTLRFAILPELTNMVQAQCDAITHVMTTAFPTPPGYGEEAYRQCLLVSAWGAHLNAMMEMTEFFAWGLANRVREMGNIRLHTGIDTINLLTTEHLSTQFITEPYV